MNIRELTTELPHATAFKCIAESPGLHDLLAKGWQVHRVFRVAGKDFYLIIQAGLPPKVPLKARAKEVAHAHWPAAAVGAGAAAVLDVLARLFF